MGSDLCNKAEAQTNFIILHNLVRVTLNIFAEGHCRIFVFASTNRGQ